MQYSTLSVSHSTFYTFQPFICQKKKVDDKIYDCKIEKKEWVRPRYIILRIQNKKTTTKKQSVDSNEAAHNEQPHLGLRCSHFLLKLSPDAKEMLCDWGRCRRSDSD